MSMIAYIADEIFDGKRCHSEAALLVEDGKIDGIIPVDEIPASAKQHSLNSGTIAPGFVDLQINGGGGVMFNDDPSVGALKTISAAHARLGTTAMLPTLITDTPAHTKAAIDAVQQAISQGVAGIIGLHLEGPHLSVARKGAHDPSLIRPMQTEDLNLLLATAKRLPYLMMTVAPENTTPDQIKALTDAGVIISLGHTDAIYKDCKMAAEHGASCATHLFNAMSQFTGREPGLVGAALDTPHMHAGLIADGIHVSPASIRTALAAKQGPAAIFLVTDAMATVGSDMTEFTLNGRTIYRRDRCLRLADGTLAGADLDIPTALQFMCGEVGASRDKAIAMATSGPAAVLKTDQVGYLTKGMPASFVHLDDDLNLKSVWQDGAVLASA